MKSLFFILILSLFTWTSVFPVDFYTLQDKKDLDKAYLYSPRKEKTEEGWEFIGGKDEDPNNPKLYENATKMRWRKKIGRTELPYKYIERKYSENSIPKKGVLSLNILGKAEVTINITGFLTPRVTGDFYELRIEKALPGSKTLIGTISGKRIANRVNLSVKAVIRDKAGAKEGEINGSLAFGLDKSGAIEKGVLAFFARIKSLDGKMDYYRISGSFNGSLETAMLKASVLDVDGKDIGSIGGSF